MANITIQRIVYQLSLTFLLVCCINTINAQFSIRETFRGAVVPPDLILGGSAKLTAGPSLNIDAPGDGWLRLTDVGEQEIGYCYLNESFPSDLGIVSEFEYKVWSSHPGGRPEADGLTFFLFDAAYGPDPPNLFKLGQPGGALGYGEVDNNTTNESWVEGPGLTGGYIGLGIDEWGNYSRKQNAFDNNAPISGAGQMRPQSIALRGPASLHTPYLAGTLSNLGGTPYAGQSISYGTATSTRPPDNVYYRRVKIVIENNQISVFMQFSETGTMQQVFTTALPSNPPALLKMGFAGSTGGAVAYHEVRNLITSTPGALRVDKSGDALAANNSNVTYRVTVYNDSKIAQTGVKITESLPADFTLSVADVTFSNNGYPNNRYYNGAINGRFFTGNLDLEPESRITLYFTGSLSYSDSLPKIAFDTAYIDKISIDPDQTNDTSRFVTLRKPILHQLPGDIICSGSSDTIPLKTMSNASIKWSAVTTGDITVNTGGTVTADASGSYNFIINPVNNGSQPGTVTYTFR